jgi:hypothetical protein
MLPGDDIYEQVDHAIRLWDKILLCCSRKSLTSWWMDNEIDNAELETEFEKVVRALRADEGGREMSPPSRL